MAREAYNYWPHVMWLVGRSEEHDDWAVLWCGRCGAVCREEYSYSTLRTWRVPRVGEWKSKTPPNCHFNETTK